MRSGIGYVFTNVQYLNGRKAYPGRGIVQLSFAAGYIV